MIEKEKEKKEYYNYDDVIQAAIVLFKGGYLEEINSSKYYTGMKLFRICRAPNCLEIYICNGVETEIQVCSIPIEQTYILKESPISIDDTDTVPVPYSNSL